jgi:hypothetical protein
MEKNRPRSRHMFSLSVWAEELEEGVVEWRGKIQHLPTGEAYYFRSWEMLLAHLRAMVGDSESQTAD